MNTIRLSARDSEIFLTALTTTSEGLGKLSALYDRLSEVESIDDDSHISIVYAKGNNAVWVVKAYHSLTSALTHAHDAEEEWANAIAAHKDETETMHLLYGMNHPYSRSLLDPCRWMYIDFNVAQLPDIDYQVVPVLLH